MKKREKKVTYVGSGVDRSVEEIEHENKSRNTRMIIILVISAVLLAVGMPLLIKGCSDIVNREAGYYAIELKEIECDEQLEKNAKLYPYYSYVGLYYYTPSNYSDRTKLEEQVSDIYNKSVADSFRLIDTNFDYTIDGSQLINLKYVNEHPNQEIVVDEYLYDCLKKAYAYTYSTAGVYNLFAGELYDYWDQQIAGIDMTANDPVNSDESVTLISNIVDKATAALTDDSVDLLFNDATHAVNFKLPAEYQDYISLNLQLLDQAFAIDKLEADLRANNYTDCYILSTQGYFKSLSASLESDDGKWMINIYNPYNVNQIIVKMNLEDAITSFVSFGVDSLGYYITDDDNLYHRTYFYSSKTGYCDEDAKSLYVEKASASMSDLAIEALLSINLNLNDLKDRIKTNNTHHYMGTYDNGTSLTLFYDSDINEDNITKHAGLTVEVIER